MKRFTFSVSTVVTLAAAGLAIASLSIAPAADANDFLDNVTRPEPVQPITL
ncbi:MAG: hypothetical protein AAF152_02500 [Cyanobacteria bacterium P01_A01_bin.114]